MTVFTISRQAGVSAEDYLKSIAKTQKFAFFSQQLFAEVAKISGQPIEDIKQLYEMDTFSSLKVFVAEMLQSFGTSGVYPLPGIGFDSSVMTTYTYAEITSDVKKELQSYSAALHEVMRKIAEKGNCFIIGRGAQCVCADMPNVVHIRLVGDYEKSIERIMKKENCNKSDAEHMYKKIEKNRKEYLEYFFNADITSPMLYHCVLNIDKMTIQQIEDIFISFMK